MKKIIDVAKHATIRGKTVTSVTIATGIPTSTLYSWKRGMKNASWHKVRQVAQFFNTTIDELIDEIPD